MNQLNAQAPEGRDNVVFSYETLTRGQIRLLSLHVTEDEPLSLSLSHHPYDASLEYDALSYAWNPPDEADGPL